MGYKGVLLPVIFGIMILGTFGLTQFAFAGEPGSDLFGAEGFVFFDGVIRVGVEVGDQGHFGPIVFDGSPILIPNDFNGNPELPPGNDLTFSGLSVEGDPGFELLSFTFTAINGDELPPIFTAPLDLETPPFLEFNGIRTN